MTTAVILRTLSFEAPAKLLSMNDRPGHWGETKRLKDAWADATGWACIQHRNTRLALHAEPDALPPSIVDMSLPIRVKRRIDPHNMMVTCKVVTDALVRVGRWWPDDNSDWITLLEPTITIGGLVTIIARERTT